MIYTLTVSPAVDAYIDLEELQVGKINVSKTEKFKVGGKGINVSFALKALGIPSIPITIVGGFTGDFIKNQLIKEFEPILFFSQTPTRINFKCSTNQEETAINIQQNLSKETIEDIRQTLMALRKEDLLIVSGSGRSEDYQYLLEGLSCRLVLDVSGSNLKKLIHLKPWIVKPNSLELLEVHLNPSEAYRFLLTGADIILHTKGEEGAILKTSQKEHILKPKFTDVKTTVGCGDTFLAGFIASQLKGYTIEDALQIAQECAYYYGKNQVFLNRKI